MYRNEFYQVLRVLYYLLYGKKCTISEKYVPRSYIVPYGAGFLFFFIRRKDYSQASSNIYVVFY